MNQLLLTTTAAVLLVGIAFADPIHDVAWKGDLAGVQRELNKGADVNAKDYIGRTPLHNAARWSHKGHKKVSELLISRGADVDAMDDDGWTPLHYAALGGSKETAKLLIVEGVDVNTKNDEGETALHQAAHGGHKEVAELLIANDADVNARKKNGDTPLDEANRRNNQEIADLLREHDGKTSEELALMPHLEYGKNQWPFTVSFTTAEGSTYVFQASGDLKNWSKVEEVNGTGGEVKVTDWREAIFQKQYYRVKLVE
jgi:ankyrin repeat protein